MLTRLLPCLLTLAAGLGSGQSFEEMLTVPRGLGVNIHFTDPRPGEMKMLAEAGFRWVRMDFFWESTEKRPGVYDFSAYERLLRALEPYGIRPLFILAYDHPLYDQHLAPHTEAGRAAFARWAAAAARHFAGRGILWEIWNEPNLKQFWKPQGNAQDYARLARAACDAVHQAAPGERCIGPATSRVPLDFIGQCLDAGLLEAWDAVSVHPYRSQGPETAVADYEALRALLAGHAPAGRRVPVLSGEWGYSSLASRMTPEQQGDTLAREFLTNLSAGIPLSIWYDWHDDGEDAKENEHHFGTVAFHYYEGRDPVYDPKPAWEAARKLTRALDGYRFEERLAQPSVQDFVLVFRKGEARKIAAWTVGPKPKEIMIGGVRLTLTASPAYSEFR